MKFSTVAFFSTMVAAVFGAPIAIKRDEVSTSTTVSTASPLGGATSILAVLGPAQSTITGLLAQLTPGGGTPVDPSTIVNVVQQVTTQLNDLNGNLNLLNGLDLEQLLGGASQQTVAQEVAALANDVTAALAQVEGVIANALPELQGPINTLK
jgi:hypothetical protein